MQKKYLKILLLLAIVSASLIAIHPAQAAGVVDILTNIASGAIIGPIAVINYFIGYVGGLFVFLGGNLVNWVLNLNSQVIQSPTVQTGWIIARDLANLGFVLAIILIAFATILRIESYEMKKTLWKLIVAALLINFSLVIAGIFIDFSGVLTDFFINKATGGGGSAGFMKVGEGLANAFQVQKFLQPSNNPDSIAKLISNTSGLALVPFAASVFFTALFTIVAALSLIGLAAMLFIRYIALNILLILMPVAWLMWIWPDLESNWGKWWSEFLRWVFFAPATSFFIYLALAIALPVNKGTLFIGGTESVLNPGNSLGITVSDIGGMLGQMISVIGILFGGLIAANKISIHGSETFLSAANGVKGYMTGTITGAATGGIRDIARTLGYKAPDKEGRGGGGLIERYSAKLAGNPIIGGVARGINEWATSGKKEQVGAYEKDLDKLSENKDAFLNMGKNPRITGQLLANDSYGAAYINKAAEKGMLKDLRKEIPADVFERLVVASKKMGTANKIYAKNPRLAALGIKNKEEAKKAIKAAKARAKPADVINFDPEDFENETILLNLTKQDIRQLSVLANPKQSEALNKGIQKIKDMIAKNELTLEADEKRNFEYLQHWDDDSIAGQTARITSASQSEFGIPKPEKVLKIQEK